MCGGNTDPCHTDGEHFSEKSLDKKKCYKFTARKESRGEEVKQQQEAVLI